LHSATRSAIRSKSITVDLDLPFVAWIVVDGLLKIGKSITVDLDLPFGVVSMDGKYVTVRVHPVEHFHVGIGPSPNVSEG
jgi:hypothetical protein